MPQISSGYLSGAAISVGSGSIFHPPIPSAERAAHRCESPRRSSTRHNNSVVPSSSSVAAGLKTLLMRYGQSWLVKIGLDGMTEKQWRCFDNFQTNGVHGRLLAIRFRTILV